MQKTIASFECNFLNLQPEWNNVFDLGVKMIEKEYKTQIICGHKVIPHDSKIELYLIDATLQEWFRDIAVREIIIYKLGAHLRICIEQFTSANTMGKAS